LWELSFKIVTQVQFSLPQRIHANDRWS